MSDPEGTLAPVKGFVVVLVVEASQAGDDHASIARVCHDFDASSVGDLAIAIEHASKSAQRQLKHASDVFRRERAARSRRTDIRAI